MKADWEGEGTNIEARRQSCARKPEPKKKAIQKQGK